MPSITYREILADFLYNRGIDHTEVDEHIDELLSDLRFNGFEIVEE